MAGRRDFALVAPQSRNFQQPARRYQRGGGRQVFTFDISSTSISHVTSRFRMNLSTAFNDIDVMSRMLHISRYIEIGKDSWKNRG